MSSFKNFMQRIKINGILLTLAMIALGLILLIVPDGAVRVICIVLGAVLAVLAVVELVGFFTAGAISDYSFAKAVGYAVIGIWLLTCPVGIISGIINVLFAVAIIVSGAGHIQTSIRLYKIDSKKWWILLLIGLVVIGLGIVAFFVTDAAFIYLGVCLIVDGVFALVKLAVFDRKLRKAKKAALTVTVGEEVREDNSAE